MWPDRVSNPGPLTYESGALRGPAHKSVISSSTNKIKSSAQTSYAEKNVRSFCKRFIPLFQCFCI